MAGTLEDFLGSFMGGTPNPAEAAQYHDRFMSTHENDRDFDNKTYHESAADYLQKLPDDQFHDMARNAVADMPAQDRAGLLGPLLSALGGGNQSGAGSGVGDLLGGLAGGGALGGIAKMLGLGSTDPANMSGDDAAKLMNYARKENPEALRQVVQEKPWFMKALGNPVVMGALAMAAQRLISRRR